MATKQAMTKEERKTITDALGMLATSSQRAAKAAKSEAVRDAHNLEATKVANLINRINTGELDL